MYKIEKGITIKNKEVKVKFPFKDMEVGDSFLFETKEKELTSARNIINSSFVYFRTKTNKDWKIATRKVENGLRVWRIK